MKSATGQHVAWLCLEARAWLLILGILGDEKGKTHIVADS